MSFPAILYAYYLGPGSVFDAYESLGSFLFWIPIFGFVFLFPLRKIARNIFSYLRSARGALVFASYLSVHLFLYGLILEGILFYVYKFPSVINHASASVSAVLAFPESTETVLEDYAFNPSVNISIPPGYDLALSLYSFGVATIVALLVLANVMKVLEMSRVCTLGRKSLAFMALPALGVAGGATCCISLPFLIYLVAPATAVVSNSIGAYYVAYVVFPFTTAVALKYNLDSVTKITSKLSVKVTKSASQK